MAREITVDEKLEPSKVVTIYGVQIRCDKCGRVIDPEEPPGEDEELYAQELIILVNVDLCVNSRIKMDYCRICFYQIWLKICDALGIDPDEEHRIGQDD